MPKESTQEALDFLFKRLEKLVNEQHMMQIDTAHGGEPCVPDTKVFDTYQKMSGLKKDMEALYNKHLVTTDELEVVENRLNALEGDVMGGASTISASATPAYA